MLEWDEEGRGKEGRRGYYVRASKKGFRGLPNQSQGKIEDEKVHSERHPMIPCIGRR